MAPLSARSAASAASAPRLAMLPANYYAVLIRWPAQRGTPVGSLMIALTEWTRSKPRLDPAFLNCPAPPDTTSSRRSTHTDSAWRAVQIASNGKWQLAGSKTPRLAPPRLASARLAAQVHQCDARPRASLTAAKAQTPRTTVRGKNSVLDFPG